MVRTGGVVTVTTSSGHGLNTIGGTSGDGIRVSSGAVDGWDDKSGGQDEHNNNAWHFPNGVNINVTGANTFTYNESGPDQSIDASFISSNNVKMYQMKRWGMVRHMYTRDLFSIADLAKYNPTLLFDAIRRGLISFNDLPSSIAQGNPASNPTVEGFAGGPHAPDKQSLPSLVNNWTMGAGGNYPKPWMSASQKITNGNYTWVGAYAKLLGLHKDAYAANPKLRSCDVTNGYKNSGERTEWNDAGEHGIYGRIGLNQTGPYASQLGFFPQKWYDQNQGTYNGAYWSNRFDPPLPDTLVWKDPAEWWSSISKKTIKVYYLDLPMNVEVAMANPDFADDDYFKGQDLSEYPDFSLNVTMLSVMVATAALARWL